MRFALKSRRGPHFPIASDAPKSMRKEIERRLDLVKDIKYEPRLINEENKETEPVYLHIYRMKAVDSLHDIEDAIVSACDDESKRRPPGQDVGFYLKRLTRPGYPLESVDSRIITSFIDSYTHARHEPLPVFGADEYSKHTDLVNQILKSISKTTTKATIDAPKSTTQESTFQRRNNSNNTSTPAEAKSTSIFINGRSSRGEGILSETSV